MNVDYYMYVVSHVLQVKQQSLNVTWSTQTGQSYIVLALKISLNIHSNLSMNSKINVIQHLCHQNTSVTQMCSFTASPFYASTFSPVPLQNSVHYGNEKTIS